VTFAVLHWRACKDGSNILTASNTAGTFSLKLIDSFLNSDLRSELVGVSSLDEIRAKLSLAVENKAEGVYGILPEMVKACFDSSCLIFY